MAGNDTDSAAGWEFWIDRGGTFTDVLGRDGSGRLHALKLLSDNDAYRDAASEGVRRILKQASQSQAEPDFTALVATVKMGTTVATNALLEHEGARTLLLVSPGFKDLLVIGDQTRPDIFALKIDRPAPLAARTVEIGGRLNASGREIEPLDHDAAVKAFEAARKDGFESVAIALINSYANDQHEMALESLAEAAGFAHITRSSEASPLIKYVPRASTAVIDAYLQPVLTDYVDRVKTGLEGRPLYFMQSSGGLSDANSFRARNAVLSGPAGGVVGMALTAREAGYDRVIGFDMGGTSTDVSRFDGQSYARTNLASLGGHRLRAPMLDVHTVAAGGGSVLEFDGERARVGPRSAGADPGPACYGRGGPAAVTDANAVLGRIQPDWFPAVFGRGQDEKLDAEASRQALSTLSDAMGLDSAEAAAEGFLDVAVEAMADAIRQISTRQGVDPRSYALNAFGGAGGQHACKVAEALGMRTALIHPQAGLLSAFGIGLAPIREVRESGIERPLNEDALSEIQSVIHELGETARTSVVRQGGRDVAVSAQLRVRVDGSDTAIGVPHGDLAAITSAFAQAHARLFGFEPSGALIMESAAVEAEGQPATARLEGASAPERSAAPCPEDTVQIFHRGVWHDAPVFKLETLACGHAIPGPALIMDANQTIVVDIGWSAAADAQGTLVLSHSQQAASPVLSTELDPITLELFNRRFMSVAEEMGVVLERTAHSVNIKERLDFSCAVFDADGQLVANAPHMPVHLGSMAASVRAALDAHRDLGPDDAIALNAPYNGGTHLPDVTVIRPVHGEDGRRVFFVAARGHHADIGGIAPGSMPPFSRTIEDEGVVLDAVKILNQGRFEEARIREILASGAHPARSPDRNIADLKAQLAACARGQQALTRLIEAEGEEVVRAYMGHIQDNAEAAVRRLIAVLRDGEAEMALDGCARIKVSIKVDPKARTAVIDFTGTSAQLANNFNAPSAVARAAVLYVLRCLVDDPIPLNEGCLKPITLILPERCLLTPEAPGAVVAGNVETSQLVVDALFAATGRLAPAQGTMNNFTFGNDQHQYYETQCGGAGAGLDKDDRVFDGANAVHTHMTNSRLTDPEVLEQRFPVQLMEHRIRPHSGGQGAGRGGDGAVRRIKFLEAMDVSLLSGRRTNPPPGLCGGLPGRTGSQRLIAADGQVTALPGKFSIKVEPGDQVEISTPGGGGLGKAIKPQ